MACRRAEAAGGCSLQLGSSRLMLAPHPTLPTPPQPQPQPPTQEGTLPQSAEAPTHSCCSSPISASFRCISSLAVSYRVLMLAVSTPTRSSRLALCRGWIGSAVLRISGCGCWQTPPSCAPPALPLQQPMHGSIRRASDRVHVAWRRLECLDGTYQQYLSPCSRAEGRGYGSSSTASSSSSSSHAALQPTSSVSASTAAPAAPTPTPTPAPSSAGTLPCSPPPL